LRLGIAVEVGKQVVLHGELGCQRDGECCDFWRRRRLFLRDCRWRLVKMSLLARIGFRRRNLWRRRGRKLSPQVLDLVVSLRQFLCG
jgi:hypothetical protein